jgi:hypothetical protein
MMATVGFGILHSFQIFSFNPFIHNTRKCPIRRNYAVNLTICNIESYECLIVIDNKD